MPRVRTPQAFQTGYRPGSDGPSLLNSRFVRSMEGLIDQVYRTGVPFPGMMLAQNAPKGVDPDGRAMAPGTATRKRAGQILGVPDHTFDRMFGINVLQAEPELYRSAVNAALYRLEWSIERFFAKERLAHALILQGAVQRDAFARYAGVRSDVRIPWCLGFYWEGIPVVAMPHMSGLNRIYNSVEERERAAFWVRPLLLGTQEHPDWSADVLSFGELFAGRLSTRRRR